MPLLVQARALLVELGLRALGLGLALARSAPAARPRRPGARVQSASARCSPATRSRRCCSSRSRFWTSALRAHAREHEGEKSDDDQGDDDDGDDGAGGHRIPPSDGVDWKASRPCRRTNRADVRPPVALDPFRRRARRPPRSSQRAADAGVTLLALTDHDTVDGVPEALAAAACKDIELDPRGGALLRPRRRTRTCTSSATALDHTDSTLLAALEDFRADRVRRILAMADRLRELGFELDDTHPTHPSPGPPAPRRRAARTANASACATRASTRTSSSPPTWSPARPTYVAPLAPDGRRRRSTSSTPPAASPSGRTRTGTSTRPIDTLREFAGHGHRRRRGVLRHPHRGADARALHAPPASAA